MAHSPARIPHPLATAIRQAMGLSFTGLMLAAPSLVLAQDTSQDGAVESDTMVVVGTALKVDVPLVETPRAVSTVNREELEERNVQQLDETFRYRAGVLSGHYGSDNDTNWFKVRGFEQSTYQDGLRLYQEGFYYWTPEPYGLESVEVFKGPSSILYGEAPPGGMINAISKRPTREQQGRFDIQVGSRDHRQVGLDASGPLTESGDVRYRMVGTYMERDGDLDHTYNDRYYFAPSLAVDATDDTTITFLASIQKDDGVPVNPFKPVYGTLQSTPFGTIGRSTNLGEPGYDKNERTQASLGYEIEHSINDNWEFEQNLGYREMDLELRSTYVLGAVNPREAGRALSYADGKMKSWTIDNRLVGNWYTDRLENTLLIGLDYQSLKNENIGDDFQISSFGDPIDMFSPEYGAYEPVSRDQVFYREIGKEQTGLYLQNQLRIDDRWVLLGGVRYDQVSTDNISAERDQEDHRDDSEVSLSAGMMYLADNGLSPYLSYTESFQADASIDFSTQRILRPRSGEQWELGIKYAPLNWDGYVTAAVFDLKESNPLYSLGGVQVQAEEKTSTGFELEAVTYLTDNLQLTAAYTYTDARGRDEQRAPIIPRHMASSWLDYTVMEGDLAGLKLGGGIRHVGESSGGSITVPSYTVGDVMASYDFADNWRAQVNVNNVTDEEYVASCEADFWCYYGESRSVIGSLSYRW